MSPTLPQSTPLIHPHATVSANPSPSTVPDTGVSSFLAQMRKRWQMASDAENRTRIKSAEDFEFYDGDGKQWPSAIRVDRDLAGRPCLEINKLKANAQQIINEQRQSRPAIQVNPVGDGADVETAQIIQGLIRHVEINSAADIAYDTAFEHAVVGGFGYIRVLTEWVPKSFDQEIVIKRVIDPFTVYFDPAAQEPDYSDAEYAFVVEDVLIDQFKAKWPEAAKASLSDFRSVGDGVKDWYTTETIRVADYYYVETVERTLVLLADNTTSVYSEDLPEDPEMPGRSGMEVAEIRGGLALKDGQPVTRKDYERRVMWRKMSALEVLEEAKPKVPGSFIPIIPVLGYELIVNGNRSLSGIVRNAKDPQRQYNYMRSAVVEAVALAPKAPFMVAEGQDEGFEDEFKQANVRNMAAIHYKPTSLGDKLVPPPQRQNVEPPIQAMSIAMGQADHDLDTTMSVYPSSRGQVGPEQSGKAILARTKRTEIANFNFSDNLGRAVRQVGRVILAMIPDVYDIPQVRRIVAPDGKQRMVPINQEIQENGMAKVFDVRVGRYDITISAGLSYVSKRQEFVESVMALVSAAPQLMAYVGDLLVKNFDWPGAAEISDRLKKMLPPQLQEPEDGSQPLPPAVQQKVAELLQQNAALLAQLQAATDTIKTERIKSESDERIATIKAYTEILKAELTAKTAEATTLAKLDTTAAKTASEHRTRILQMGITAEQQFAAKSADMAHDVALQATQQAHEQEMAKAQPPAQPTAQ